MLNKTLFSAALIALALPGVAAAQSCPAPEQDLVVATFEGSVSPAAQYSAPVTPHPAHDFTVPADCSLANVRVVLSWTAVAEDVDLYVYNPDGSDLANSQDINAASGSATETLDLGGLAAGTYSALVRAYVAAGASSYTLTVTYTGGAGEELGEPVVVSDPDRPRVVVADIDSAINPYHEFFYAGSRIYPSGHPSAVTQEILDSFEEVNGGPVEIVKLTRTGDITADIVTDKAFWDSVEHGKLYHFLGTNIIAASFSPANIPPLDPTIDIDGEDGPDKSPHGAGTASAVLVANPDAVILFLETHGDLGADGAHQLAFTHPTVDIVTTSYGVSIPQTGFQLPENAAFHKSYEGVVENGKLHFSSAGNNVGLSNFRAGAGPWWSIGVSGIGEDGSEGDTLLSGNLADFVSDFTQDLVRCMICESGTGDYSGTRLPTPRAAGVASLVIQAARDRLGHSGGIVDDGAGKPVMASGYGLNISNWFVRRALEQAAFIPDSFDYDPVASVNELGALPINPLAPWTQIHWGDLTTNPDKGVVEAALVHLNLEIGATREKNDGYCEFQTSVVLERKAYWDEIASLTPPLVGSDQPPGAPDTDPFIYCAAQLPGYPASNDPGGQGLDPEGDIDGDSVTNDTDNCPFDANPSQSDADGDGSGDACDTDSGGQQQTNNPPVAALSASTTSSQVGAVVSFDASASTDPDAGDVLSYAFDFGDGTSLVQDQPLADHSYSTAGDYVVSVTVSDGELSDTASVAIAVVEDSGTGGPAEISAELSTDKTSGAAPLTVRFDASASTYEEGALIEGARYTFVYGDGNRTQPLPDPVISYTYQGAGTFNAFVIVTDQQGNHGVSEKIAIRPTITVTATEGEDAEPVVERMVEEEQAAEGYSVSGQAKAGQPTYDYALPVHTDHQLRAELIEVTISLDNEIDIVEVILSGNGIKPKSKTGSSPLVLRLSQPADGDYTITLKEVETTAGTMMTTVADVTLVPEVARRTVAILHLDNTSGVAPLTVTFDGSQSMAGARRQIVAYEFDFDGDGVVDVSGPDAVVTHIYTIPGTYTPALEVVDSLNVSAESKATVQALAPPGTDPGPTPTPRPVTGSRSGGSLGWLVLLPMLAAAGRRRRRHPG